eukprot:3073690-Pyramimonas_sp.AAC.1
MGKYHPPMFLSVVRVKPTSERHLGLQQFHHIVVGWWSCSAATVLWYGNSYVAYSEVVIYNPLHRG